MHGFRLFGFAAASLLAAATVSSARGQDSAAVSAACAPWPAVDALGRSLPGPEQTGPARTDRFVGLFYFLWHNQRRGRSPHWDGPYDISRILARDPDAVEKPNSPLWGAIGMYHYWGEPLYGYYLSADPWVLRRHGMLLADAGVDTLIFDTTNAVTYRDVYHELCRVFCQLREEGTPAPQIAFMVNTRAGATARKIYHDLYQPGHYQPLWFQWQGKPLMICDPEQADAELQQFFTLRRAHWPFTQVNTPYAWHWEAAYPQVYGYTDDPQQPEQVNVSVAQNLRQRDGRVTNMSAGDARGRSFHAGRTDQAPDAVNWGHNVQEQWTRAWELDPPFVMVTGWNEWIAGRWGEPDGPIVFVDQFDQECSRDIEPARGAHRDNYYWQMVANVRRYKGTAPLPPASAPQSIQIDGDFRQWSGVGPEFRDHRGETAPRDFDGAAGLHYTNTSGRNDLAVCKVARDDAFVYFYVQTVQPLTPHNDSRWMWLLLDTDGDATTGWEGYDVLVNRQAHDATTTCLECYDASDQQASDTWQWRRVATVDYRVQGDQLHLAIPRQALGIAGETTDLAIDFKWLDNVQQPADIMDWYVNGDVAPEGRFKYRYRAGADGP
jgi:hypothetical protein